MRRTPLPSLTSVLQVARWTHAKGINCISLPHAAPRGVTSLQPACLLSVFFLIYLATLAVGPAGGSSEARELHVIDSIISQNEWILPLRNGLIPSKPPLYHWIGALVLKSSPLDTSLEVAGRLVSLVAGMLVLLCTALLARGIASNLFDSQKAAREAAYTALAVMVTTYGFVSMAVSAMVDMLYASLVVAAITTLLLPLTRAHGGLRRPMELVEERDFLLFYVCCGLGVLAKGPLACVLPLLVCSLAHARVFGLRASVALWLRPRLGWLLFLFLAVPWYVMAAQHGGAGFIDRQIIFENVQRFVGGEHVNEQEWWFYLPSLLRTAFPWSLLWVTALMWQCNRLRGVGASLQSTARSSRVAETPAIWVVSALVLFSFSAGKRHSYLLPLYPAMAISVALFLLHWWRGQQEVTQHKLRVWAVRAASLLTVAVAACCVTSMSGHLLQRASPAALQEFGVFLLRYQPWISVGAVFGLLASLFFLLRAKASRAPFQAYVAVTMAATCALSIILQIGVGFKNHLKDFDRIAVRIDRLRNAGERTAFLRYRWEEYLDPLGLYLQGAELLLHPEGFQNLPHPTEVLIAPSRYDRDVATQQVWAEVGRFRQRADQIKGRSDRDIVMWRYLPDSASGMSAGDDRGEASPSPVTP